MLIFSRGDCGGACRCKKKGAEVVQSAEVEQVQRCRCKKGAGVTRWGVLVVMIHLSAEVVVGVEFQER